MTALDLIARLRARGVTLSRFGARLRCRTVLDATGEYADPVVALATLETGRDFDNETEIEAAAEAVGLDLGDLDALVTAADSTTGGRRARALRAALETLRRRRAP